jgi:2-aminoadipate transaminase
MAVPAQRAAKEPSSRAANRAQSIGISDLLRLGQGNGVISLAGGVPASEAFPVAALAEAAETILATDPGRVLQYSVAEGYEPLRAWCADWWSLGDRAVVVTAGSQQAIELVLRSVVDEGDLVAITDPGYLGAIQAARLVGARMVGVPSDADGLCVDVLEDLLRKGSRVVAAYVVPNFDNPTGATLSLERRYALAALAETYGFIVLEDDPYSELRWRGDNLPSLATMSDRVVAVRSTSKILAPGLRVGFLAADAKLAAAVARVKQIVDVHTSTFTQQLCFEVVTRPAFLRGHVANLVALYGTRATALVDALRANLGNLSFHEPDGGMFVWGQLDDGDVSSNELLSVAMAEGVAFAPGPAFSVEAGHDNFLRLSFAAAAPEQLADAAARLGRAVRLSAISERVSYRV